MAACLIVLAVAWTFGPLAHRFDARWFATEAARLKDWPLAPVAIAVVFLLACLVGVPATLSIATMMLLFGPWRGSLYAYANLLLSGSVIYVVARSVARSTIDRWLASHADARWASVNARLARRGLIAVALVRLTPLPFAIQNLMLGASRIGYPDFLFGTMLGLVPITLLMAGLATQFAAWLAAPDVTHLAWLIAATLVVIAIAWSIGRWVVKRSSRG